MGSNRSWGATRERVQERWGIPFHQLLRDFADQGLGVTQVSKALGCRREPIYDAARRLGITFEVRPMRSRVSQEHGRPFVSVVRAMAAKGMTLNAIGDALGAAPSLVEVDTPVEIKRRQKSIAERYFAEAGETVRQAITRMKQQGLSREKAAVQIGFSAGSGLIVYLRSRGITDPWFKGARHG